MSALQEEPKDLPNHQVYQGGSHPSVQCVNCFTTTTSGSWRRGWKLSTPPGGEANLCNKCGQRWVKLCRSLGKLAPTQSGSALDTSSLPPSSGVKPNVSPGSKRPLGGFDSSQIPTYMGRRASSTIRLRLPSEPPSSDGSDMESPVTAPEPKIPRGLEDPYTRPTNGYCMQRISDNRATYALFWVIGSPVIGENGLAAAAVGFDPRSDGHFTYYSIPEVSSIVAPLRTTNRADVVAWMASTLGVNVSLSESIMQPPLVTVVQVQRLWVAAAEASARYQQQQPQQRYFTEAHFSPHVAGRLSAASTPTGPVGLSLHDSPDVAHPASRSPTKLEKGAKVKPGASVPPLPVATTPVKPLPRFRCSVCGTNDHSTDGCPWGCTSPPILIHNPATEPSGLDALLVPGVGEEQGLGADLHAFLQTLGEDTNSPMQDTVFDAMLDFHFGPGSSAIPSPVGGEHPFDQAAAAVGSVLQPPQPQRQAQHAQQQPMKEVSMSSWTSSLNAQDLEDTIKAWAASLNNCMAEATSAAGAGISQNGAAAATAAARKCISVGEVLSILSQLNILELSMEMLARTKISESVAALSKHSNIKIAGAAQELASKWKESALGALQSVSSSAPRA